MKMIKHNYRKITIIFISILVLLNGLNLLLKTDYFVLIDINLYKDRLIYLDGNNWYNYFTDSIFAFENSILFSILCTIFLNFKFVSAYYISSIIVTVIIFIMIVSLFVISEKSNISIFLISIFLIFNLLFNSNYFILETKIVILGFLIYLYSYKFIKNKYILFALVLFSKVFMFSIVYLLLDLTILIVKIISKKLEIIDFVNIFISLILGFLLLDFSMDRSHSELFNAIVQAVNFNSSKLSEFSFSFLGLIFMGYLLMNCLIIFIENRKEKELYVLIITIIELILFLYLFKSSNVEGVIHSYKSYFILMFLIVWLLLSTKAVDSENMNLYSDGELKFSISKMVSLISAIIFLVGASSYHKEEYSKDDFLYLVNYDLNYILSVEQFDNNQVFYNIEKLKETFELLNIEHEYKLETNEGYTTFSNSDIFIYGFGEVEDSNGSRWTTKYNAVNMFGRNMDNLLIAFYNPSDRVGIKFEVYVDNKLVYSDISSDGSQVIMTDNLDISEGNHIIKIVYPDLEKNTDLGLYVTNIIVARLK